MTNLETIRAKCIEANPEIVELKFGCEVREGGYIFKVISKSGFEYTNYLILNIQTGGIQPSQLIGAQWNIIGRPIRLSDVMLAYGETKSGFPFKNRDEIVKNQVNTIMYITSNWDMRKDDLTLQSEEMIDFLYQLLK